MTNKKFDQKLLADILVYAINIGFSNEPYSNQKLHFEPLILPAYIRKDLAEAKKQGKLFLPIGTTMIRFLESLPYIWRFLKSKNLTCSQN